MSEPFDQRLFENIFSDAHVVDVDFSQWDKHITLCVIADHIEVPTPSRLPLFLITFVGVSKFSVAFSHLTVKLDDPAQHFQWNIDDFRIDEVDDRFAISLFGGKTWPMLEVECQTIKMRPIPHSILDEAFPGWNTPYGGLARPGIESLSDP